MVEISYFQALSKYNEFLYSQVFPIEFFVREKRAVYEVSFFILI